jgi:hypothetical protein
MADFAFVKDPNGKVLGVWVARAEDARDHAYLVTLLMRGGVAIEDLTPGMRVVPNRGDSRGGVFAMLGALRAPGE